MTAPAIAGTWLVETALKGAGPTEWDARSGYGSEASARREAKQLGAQWRRQGYRVRVRFEADVTATCNVCNRPADDPFRVRSAGVITAGCVARIHDAHLSGDSLAWVRDCGMPHRLTGWNGY